MHTIMMNSFIRKNKQSTTIYLPPIGFGGLQNGLHFVRIFHTFITKICSLLWSRPNYWRREGGASSEGNYYVIGRIAIILINRSCLHANVLTRKRECITKDVCLDENNHKSRRWPTRVCVTDRFIHPPRLLPRPRNIIWGLGLSCWF